MRHAGRHVDRLPVVNKRGGHYIVARGLDQVGKDL
jgi:hypothetical protein